jgi:hypothetical protein
MPAVALAKAGKNGKKNALRAALEGSVMLPKEIRDVNRAKRKGRQEKNGGRSRAVYDFASLCGVCFSQARQNFFTSTLYSFRLPREKW